MNKHESEFWRGIRQLTALDDHVEAPLQSVNAALSLFQASDFQVAPTNWLFSLRPAFLGSVRKSGPAKEFYEIEDKFVVQLEKTREEMTYHLVGFAHDLEASDVVLYGQESVFETKVDAGNFEFRGLPCGTYHLSFSLEGEVYWIRGLELNA